MMKSISLLMGKLKLFLISCTSMEKIFLGGNSGTNGRHGENSRTAYEQ